MDDFFEITLFSSKVNPTKSPREDIFYRNTLATLIEEDVIYEKEYVNEVNYGININSAFVELSKS